MMAGIPEATPESPAVATVSASESEPNEGRRAADAPSAPPRFGRVLLLWMALVVLLHAVAWLSGHRGNVLAEAIERGAARVESWTLGEVPDDAIRKAIALQKDSLPFWLALMALGDFALDPFALAARAALVAVGLASVAALSGRPVRFEWGMAACARGQWPWVLGLAVQVALMLALGRDEVETSATLLLPPGAYAAATWTAMRQADAFALLGWALLAWGGWRRGQANLLVATLICLVLAVSEAALRTGWILFLGAGMRLTLLPA
jgi:hypothetical protein